MLRRSFLAASTVACVLATSQGAYAGVKFVETFAGAGAQAEAWNGIAEKPKSDSQSRSREAKTLKKAKTGITALPIASASSGGKRNAFVLKELRKLGLQPTPARALSPTPEGEAPPQDTSSGQPRPSG
jgi:hypothetical protein